MACYSDTLNSKTIRTGRIYCPGISRKSERVSGIIRIPRQQLFTMSAFSHNEEELIMTAETSNDFFVDASTIARSPLGQELSPEQCAKLAAIVSARGLEKGMFLFEEGDKDDSIHVITLGQLEVVKQTGGGEWLTLQVLRTGDMAGEMSFIDGLEHSAAIRALGNAEVFTLSREDMEKLLDEDPQLVYQVMRAIIRTVHGILRRMNLQFVEMTNYMTKSHGRY